jgi:serine/threonine protein kinase
MSAQVPREKAVFVAALEIADPLERRKFIDQACGADQALREQVERLLALSGSAGDFFKECGPALARKAADAEQVLSAAGSALLESELPETKRIGPYKLLQKLGEGGYGVVYMAEQEEPIRRRVALKIIKLGMDTRNVIARFEAERQALALMDHPNIARVLDAGATETGRPYFVMELVYGVKITEYCDQNRVSMEERLELFIQVCNAVQHAHQKGIIHRDLKPSNIMVTMHDGVPVPKVIDFGIAKATEQRLTDKTLFTSYAQLMGTPAYMSPEQMELSGLNLDTRSDIYSLGILLYELLTGRTPFDTTELLKLGVEEMRRTVCEREPLSPSAKLKTLTEDEVIKAASKRLVEAPRLMSQLRGDLDWIVLKCLEKDRTRRYATANALGEDIERYLHEEAILARPPSQMYRLQKLVHRNLPLFLFGAATAAILLLATVISTIMFIKERRAGASEARLRKEAEVREKPSHVALLVTQRQFEEADKLLVEIPLNNPSIEVAGELRALGDWYAAKGNWSQAAQRCTSLVKVDQLDGREVISLDQLRLAAALIKAGDWRGYERLRQDTIASLTPGTASVPASILKACLLLPASPDLVERLASSAEPKNVKTPNASAFHLATGNSVAWSDAKALFEYRQGHLAVVLREKFLADNPPRLATFSLVQAMASWQSKDYWGAMISWTKGYALLQAGARQSLISLTVRSEIFPAMGEPDYLEAAWYDWTVAELLLREWDEMLGAAEHSVNRMPGRAPGLEELAIVRAAAECHALRGEWTQALSCAQYCREFNQQDSLDHATMDYVNAALACLELGDEKTYLHLRQEMVTRFKASYEVAPWRTLEVGLLRPLDDGVATNFNSLAAGIAGWSRSETNNYWGLMLLSLHSYRNGDYAGAMDLVRDSLLRLRDGTQLPDATLGIISALSLNRLGNRSAALSELERAERVLRTGFDLEYDMWHWRHWLGVRLLLKEARSLISPTSPAQPSVAPR